MAGSHDAQSYGPQQQILLDGFGELVGDVFLRMESNADFACLVSSVMPSELGSTDMYPPRRMYSGHDGDSLRHGLTLVSLLIVVHPVPCAHVSPQNTHVRRGWAAVATKKMDPLLRVSYKHHLLRSPFRI